jgi:hypothetical protein
MLARLDEPPRPIGAVKTAEAKRGIRSLQSLVRMSRVQMSLVWMRLVKTALQTGTGATPSACGDEAIPVAAFGLP